jgi:hypothetical protein
VSVKTTRLQIRLGFHGRVLLSFKFRSLDSAQSAPERAQLDLTCRAGLQSRKPPAFRIGYAFISVADCSPAVPPPVTSFKAYKQALADNIVENLGVSVRKPRQSLTTLCALATFVGHVQIRGQSSALLDREDGSNSIKILEVAPDPPASQAEEATEWNPIT